MVRRLAAVLVLALVVPAAAAAQGTVFLVRHAERADAGMAAPMKGADPDLSAEGRARAELLVTMLKDAGITRIISTELKRSQQTVAPLAAALKIEITTIPADATAKVVAMLKEAPDTTLVVGHSNTVPAIIAGLGVTTAVKIEDGDYDNLFIVQPGSPAKMIRLHF